MLYEGPHPSAIPEELAALTALQAANPDAQISYARRDENEAGPLLVDVGDDLYLIEADGTTTQEPRKVWSEA